MRDTTARPAWQQRSLRLLLRGDPRVPERPTEVRDAPAREEQGQPQRRSADRWSGLAAAVLSSASDRRYATGMRKPSHGTATGGSPFRATQGSWSRRRDARRGTKAGLVGSDAIAVLRCRFATKRQLAIDSEDAPLCSKPTVWGRVVSELAPVSSAGRQLGGGADARARGHPHGALGPAGEGVLAADRILGNEV
jgi:hypothetical protein